MEALDFILASQRRRQDVDHDGGPRPTHGALIHADVLVRAQPAHHRAAAINLDIDRRLRVRYAGDSGGEYSALPGSGLSGAD